MVYIEGQLQTRKWTDQSGQDRYTTEIVVNHQGTMQMLDRKTAPGENGDYQMNQDVPAEQPHQQKQQGNDLPTFDDMDDDIPF